MKKLITPFRYLKFTGFKTSLFLFLGVLSVVNAFGQTTVFVDDFNRAALTGGSPTMTYESTSSASGIITVSNVSAPNSLSIYTNTTAGRTYVHGQTSSYLSIPP